MMRCFVVCSRFFFWFILKVYFKSGALRVGTVVKFHRMHGMI